MKSLHEVSNAPRIPSRTPSRITKLMPFLMLYALILCALGLGAAPAAQAAAGDISTVAGNGSIGFSGDGGQATSAQFYFLNAVALDGAGNTYICDRVNKRVRKVNTSGIISTFAGNGTENVGRAPGPATSIALVNPTGIVTDSSNNVYIADSYSVFKVDTTGYMTLFAGRGTGGDGGQAVGAALSTPTALAIDRLGNIYIAENDKYRVRKVAPNGIISTVAGNGQGGYSGDGGPATSAALFPPQALAVDSVGNLYIGENARVRKVNTSGIISTYAGTGSIGYNGDNIPSNTAQLWGVSGLAVDSKNNLYISDEQNNRVRKVVNGLITSFAGNGNYGFSGDGQPAAQARIAAPRGLWIDSSDNLYITDYGNSRIRKVDAKDDPSPTIFAVRDVEVSEGNSGSKNLTFTVQRVGDLNKVSSVTYRTSDDTAISDVTAFQDDSANALGDYKKTSGRLNFEVGETSKTVNVTVLGDVLVEGDERFNFTLSDPLAATLADPNFAVGTIRRDDNAPFIDYYDYYDYGFTPMSGYTGTSVVIHGYDFENVYAVSFNGVPAASFTVDNSANITAMVPEGATTGRVTVFAPGVSNTSEEDFTVLPRDSSVVNSTNDVVSNSDGTTSLREALLAASGNPATIIRFDPTVFSSAQTITVGSPLQILSGNIALVAPTAGVTITGGGQSFSVFQVNPDASAEFNGLTISGGSSGILNSGTALIKNCTLSGNTTGISNDSVATIQNCTFSGNTNFGIFNSSSATIQNCTLSNNGGGISNTGTADLTNTLFAANGASPFVGFTNPGTGGDGNKNYSFASAAAAGLEVDGSGKGLLKNNGGPTQTIALQTGSPVLDKGNSSLSTDQRGAPRSGSGSDIGAYERQQAVSIRRIDAQRGPVGSFVIITGSGLNPSSGVSFNGTPAQFSIVSSNRIIARVPSGAKTGAITVTTGEGSVSSAGTLTPVFTVTSAGTVTSWGSNPSGGQDVPAGLSGVVAVAAGYHHGLALKSDGTVVGWGGNGSGEATIPAGLSGVVAIAAGNSHSLALKSDGSVVAWGSNTAGNDNVGQSTVPAGLSGVVAIAAGSYHNLALKSDGTVVAWGYNENLQAAVPTDLRGVVGIGAGFRHSIALKDDGTVLPWGDNFYFQREVPGDATNVIAIAAGGYQSRAVRSDGIVKGWGYDGGGRRDFPSEGGAAAVSVNFSLALTLKSDGTVSTWGSNAPATPAGLGRVQAIAAGSTFALAVLPPANRAPINSVPASATMAQGTLMVFSTANNNRFSFSDADSTDTQIVTLSSVNGRLQLGGTTSGVTITGDGTANVTLSGSQANLNAALDGLSFIPATGYSGNAAKVTMLTTDDGTPALSDTDTVTFTVTKVNRAPVAAADNAGVLQGGTVVVRVLQNDSDADGDTLSLSAVTQGSKGSVTINADGTVSYASNVGSGSDSFTYTLSDGQGGSATGTVTVTVTGAGSISDVSASVNVTRYGIAANASTRRFVQQVLLQNKTGVAITTPVFLVLDNLSAGAALYNKSGNVVSTAPTGSPYLTIPGGLGAGESKVVTLEFTRTGTVAINYATRVFTGTGTP
jgi:hypothetical protein